MAKKNTERRRHKRVDLSCPIRICDDGGDVLAVGKTINVSNGGVWLPVPVQAIPRLNEKIQVKFSVPRSTPNTYMLEDFSCNACVVRHHPLVDDGLIGVAIQFNNAVQLGLVV